MSRTVARMGGWRNFWVPHDRWALALLALLLVAVFAPLFLGYHFLPFGRYGVYAQGLAESMGNPPPFDETYFARYYEAPWIFEPEPAWFTLYLPQGLYTAAQLREGRIPLWDPYTGCGTPTFDSGYFRPFDPFKLPFYLFPNLWTFALGLVLLLGFGVWGAWRWFREEGLSPPAQALGCAVFALNPWVLERLALPDAAAYLVFPWCIVGLRRIRPGDWRSQAKATLPLVLMGNIGHVEVCLILAIVAGLAALVPGGLWDGIIRRGRGLVAVALAVLAALAILWVPFVTLALDSVSYKETGVELAFPYAWKAILTPSADLYILPVIGGAVLSGLLWGDGRIFWSVWMAIALLVLLPLPLLGRAGAEVLSNLTGVVAMYFKPILWLSLAALSAKGWEKIGREGPRRALVAACASGALAAGSGLLLFWVAPLPATELAALPAVTLVLALAGTAAPLLLAVRNLPWAPAAAFVLALAPLAFPLPLNQLTWNRFRLADHDLAGWMKSSRPHDRAVSIGFRPSFPISPNWGQALGVRIGEHNSVFFPNEFLPLFASPDLPMTLVAFTSPQLDAFRQLGATLLLVPNPHPIKDTRLSHAGRWASAHTISNASGRLFFALGVTARKPGVNIPRQILDFGLDSDTVAVVDDPGGTGAGPPPASSQGLGEARFLKDGIHEVVLATRNPEPGLLVLRDTWYRGWRATVDGRLTPIYRVNGCFRGVVVPAGDHTVRFLYRPRTLYAAAAVSLLATLLLAALALRTPRMTTPLQETAP